MRAVGQTVAALRSSHVAAVDATSSDGRHVSNLEGKSRCREVRRVPGPEFAQSGFADGRNLNTVGSMEELATLRNELLALRREVTAFLQLKAVAQSLAAPETGRSRVETGDRRKFFRERKKSENQSGQRAAQTDAVTLGVLQQMKESVAALRAEVDNLQRAEVGAVGRQRVDAPFAYLAAGVVGGVRAGVNPGRLSEPAEGFSGGFGSPVALTERDAHPDGGLSKLREQVTSAGTAADVVALQESVAQLTRELLALRSGAAALGFGSGSGSGSAHVRQQLVTSGLIDKASGGQVFATKVGEARTEGEGARSVFREPERNGPVLVPSELLQREIAEARAELAALRSGSKGFPALGTEQKGPESGNDLVIERAEVSKGGRSSVRWADGDLTEGVEPSGNAPGEAAATGNSSWGGDPGHARGIPWGSSLTWTDLATCLEQSDNEPVRGRLVSIKAANVGSGRSGASVQAAQRTRSVDKLLVRNASERPYPSRKPFAYERKLGNPAGRLPLERQSQRLKLPPQTAVKAPLVDRKEKQNKVGYAPKRGWANPASVFEVIS
ncbi:hypothetical protein KFL_001210240 [Klebsormidium nitens]|uniref:Uncharacterized protein n=1 Tax=Klebsormidium nitens TaxID=105231 RepID=A0A1Y1HVS5_KLENI|nr:hypothetical protein KFL_001210240 [Klebsormidium nitens]|eukprot:GAQ82730.1 hypothetical protein KFL_001210240 [Klebsormidium nitens]